MQQKSKSWLWITAFILLIPALAGCNASGSKSPAIEPKQHTYFIFDTVVTVKIYDERANERHFEDIDAILKEIDSQMSRTLEASDIYKVNMHAGSGKSISVSPETIYVVQRALHYSALTEGRFDLTVGPLVSLWQIGTDGALVPTSAELEAAIQLVDYKLVGIDEKANTLQLPLEGMAIDLGAIAKGYAADRIAEYLTDQDIHSAIIDLGGNIFALGSKPGDSPWTIGIQDPEDDRGKPIGKVSVRNKTIVSSGVYERFFIEDNVRYHHILDSTLGHPVRNELVSVTIITDRSIDADALSTSIFTLGLEEGLQLIELIANTEAIFITDEHKVYITSGLDNVFELTVDKYKLAEPSRH